MRLKPITPRQLLPLASSLFFGIWLAACDPIAELDNWYANESQYSCEIDLEEKLRDPNSYKRDGEFITSDDNGSKKVIAWKFRAKNGFGGFDVGTALCSVSKKNGGTVRVETISN